MQLNMLALGVVILNIAVVCVIYAVASDRISMPQLVGILSGAVTNTPGLGAAQQTLSQLQFDGKLAEVPEIASAYAAAYPLGVIGIILSMILIRYIFRINNENETKRLEAEKEASTLVPHIVTYKVENPLIVGRTLEKLAVLIDRNFVVSRVQKDGEVIIPDDNTVIGKGDLLLIVLSEEDEDAMKAFIGPVVEMDWKLFPRPSSPAVSLLPNPSTTDAPSGRCACAWVTG